MAEEEEIWKQVVDRDTPFMNTVMIKGVRFEPRTPLRLADTTLTGVLGAAGTKDTKDTKICWKKRKSGNRL
jgi:hypothetical protein